MLLQPPVLRVLMCLLALCVGLQGLALSSMRALGRSHYHLAPSATIWVGAAAYAPPSWNLLDWAKTQQPPVSNAVFVHQGARAIALADAVDASHQHAHATRAHHAHDAHDKSAVWVAEDDGTSAQKQAEAPSRALHDLDALPVQVVPASNTPRPEGWAHLLVVATPSHVTAPLKRPPKA
jgi:hypothetical protein